MPRSPQGSGPIVGSNREARWSRPESWRHSILQRRRHKTFMFNDFDSPHGARHSSLWSRRGLKNKVNVGDRAANSAGELVRGWVRSAVECRKERVVFRKPWTIGVGLGRSGLVLQGVAIVARSLSLGSFGYWRISRAHSRRDLDGSVPAEFGDFSFCHHREIPRVSFLEMSQFRNPRDRLLELAGDRSEGVSGLSS